MKKRRRLKKSVIYSLIAIVVIVVLIFVTVTLSKKGKTQEENTTLATTTSHTISDDDINDIIQENQMQINMGNFKIEVGKQIMITASFGEQVATNIVAWKSANESVFTIDENGVLTAVGVGKAALTATMDLYSDAIIVEVVATKSEDGDLNLPNYDEAVKPSEPSTQGPTQGPTQRPTQGPTQGPTQAPTEAPTQGATQ